MKKRIMTLMAGMLLLLTACGQTGNSSASTMLPVAVVQSAAQVIAPVEGKAEMPQKEEKTEDSADAPRPVERAGAENADNAAEKQLMLACLATASSPPTAATTSRCWI